MKAVLLSIQPQWCAEIVELRKTLEVRRNRPKIEPPFKVYIYCTMNHSVHDLLEIHIDGKINKANGNVIGEFVCDNIRPFDVPYPAYQNELDPAILEKSCLTYYQLHRYAYHDCLYGWNISNLVIYDKPKDLIEFCFPPERFCEPGLCGNCPKYESPGESGDVMWDCEWKRPILRPPQSWCYVEEVGHG